jgi:hypothetical protein
MVNINRTPSNEEQKFKQIENDSWSGIYLPAICAGVVMTIFCIGLFVYLLQLPFQLWPGY